MKFASNLFNFYFLINEKSYKKLSVILYLLFFITYHIQGQEIHFSQLSQTQFFSNPSFTGIQFGPRALFHFRNQYPKIGAEVNSGFNTIYASYDQYIDGLNSGLGVQFMGDRYGDDIFNRYYLTANYAYQAKFNESEAIRIGLSGSAIIQQLDRSKLRFFDQIDPIYGFNNLITTQENVPDNFSQTFFNFNAGALYFKHNFYVGLSVRNLLPKKNFYNPDNTAFQDLTLSLQTGGVLWLNKDNRTALFPYLLIDRQYNYNKIVGNFIYQYKLINAGIGFRHNSNSLESIILLTGINVNKLRFSYSFDVNTNGLNGYSGGSHELGFRILINGEDNSLHPNEYKNILFCPDFMKN